MISEATYLRARVAALARVAKPLELKQARRDLAVANTRLFVDKQRAKLDLPPVSDEYAKLLTALLLSS